MQMKNLFCNQFPNTASSIGYESFGFTFSSCPTKAVGELSPLATPNLTSGFSREPQLPNYGFLNILKMCSSPKFLEYVYHYGGQFGWRRQLCHTSNLTINLTEVNNFPDIALVKAYL